MRSIGVIEQKIQSKYAENYRLEATWKPSIRSIRIKYISNRVCYLIKYLGII